MAFVFVVTFQIQITVVLCAPFAMFLVLVRAFQAIVLFARTFYDDFGFCARISGYGSFVHTFSDGFSFCAHVSGCGRFYAHPLRRLVLVRIFQLIIGFVRTF